ncbi:MAG: hypothetical protein ACERLM_08430, partial [Acidimicrobiales bacterium]
MSESHPPSMITRDDVAHVAHLARLTLTEDELDRFTEQLAAVLDHASDVEALEIDDVPRPQIQPGYVLVAVRAAAMNHLDLWARRGLPGLRLEF